MQIKDIDSSKLLLDIHAEDLDELLRAKFPEFAEYQGKVAPIKVAQYIILMSDMYSPMRIEKPDFYQRKYACAVMANFPRSKKEFSEEAERIIIGDDIVVNQTMVSYILSYGLPSFALLQANMALLSVEMQKVFKGKHSKDSQKILDSANDRIQSLTRDFFRSGDYDEYSKVREVLYARVEKEREKLRPEQIIRYLEDNGSLPEDFNPYEGYTVDPAKDLQFIGDK